MPAPSDLREIVENVKAFQSEINAIPGVARAEAVRGLKKKLAAALSWLPADETTKLDSAILAILMVDLDRLVFLDAGPVITWETPAGDSEGVADG